MVGDTFDYVKLLSLVKKKVAGSSRGLYCSLTSVARQKPLDVPPSQFIAGSGSGDDSGADLDDDTQICSCHVSVVCSHIPSRQGSLRLRLSRRMSRRAR